MFIYCPITNKICPFCGKYEKNLYCGIAKKENKIKNMNTCPYKPRKRK